MYTVIFWSCKKQQKQLILRKPVQTNQLLELLNKQLKNKIS